MIYHTYRAATPLIPSIARPRWVVLMAYSSFWPWNENYSVPRGDGVELKSLVHIKVSSPPDGEVRVAAGVVLVQRYSSYG